MTSNTHPSQIKSNRNLWQDTYQKFGIAKLQIPTGVNNILDLLQPNINRNSDKTALSMGSAKLTYAQLDNASQKFACFLQTQGYDQGTRIALQMPNILQYMVITLGCLRAGMVVVNVNPLYTSYELAHQLTDSQAQVLVIFDAMNQAYEGLDDTVKNQLKQVIICSMTSDKDKDNDLSLMMSPVEDSAEQSSLTRTKLSNDKIVKLADILTYYSTDEWLQPSIEMNDIAVLQYTGGTTGKAKGAILTHKNLVTNVIQCYDFFGDKLIKKTTANKIEQVKLLNPLPLYHIFSFTVCGLLCIYSGWEDILITNPRDMDGLVNSIETNKPNIIPSVNTLFAGMLAHPKFATLDFSHLYFSIGGGTAIIPDIANQWQAVTGTTINEGLGMSEASPVISFNPMGITKFRGNVGIPLNKTDIIIVDDEDNICENGEAGEVCIKGPQVMQGYWQRDNSTAFIEIGQSDNYTGQQTNRYFRTGDVGYLADDGYLTLVDRKKDMILVSGFNVYPNEIEAVITEHPKVFEVGVVGIANEKSGEAPKAFIVKSDDSLTEDEVADFVSEHLTNYKRPISYEFISELPKSAVGKILRKELRKI